MYYILNPVDKKKKKQIYQNSIALISKWYSYSGLPRKTVKKLIDDLL